MNLKSLILAEHSKANTQAIANQIGDDVDQFKALWELILHGEPPVPQRAAWVLDTCVAAYPELFKPSYLAKAIKVLLLPNHNAVQRNLTKILARMEIPEQFQGELYDLCINWLIDPKIPVAIKAHSMTITLNIALGIPELEEELALVIEDQMEFNSAGFKSRGRHMLKKLKRK